MTAEDRKWPPRGRSELWSLREDVRVELKPTDGPIMLRSHWGDVTIQRPSPPVREALRRMLLGPISLENVISGPIQPPGGQAPDASMAVLLGVLDRLQPLVIRTLGLDSGQPLLSVVPITPRSSFHPVPLAADTRVWLSPFTRLYTDGNEYRLESPLSLHRVLLHRAEAVWLLSSLSRPTAAVASASMWPHHDSLATDMLAYLVAANMVVEARDMPGRPDTTEDSVAAGWSAMDLMFHSRSNTGRHDAPVGATYPMGTDGSPEPVVQPARADSGIPLHRPTWERLSAADPPLGLVMEGRRSTRIYGAEPVTAEELGDLLYRAARVRSIVGPPSSGPYRFAPGTPDPRLSDRPYPSGGASYELELYVTVGECTGIPRGVYHYDPFRHRLEPVNSDRGTVRTLLKNAAESAAMEVLPPVLITLTARYRRVSWKYEGLAYATVLKDVGVLLQNLYLICTAMRLAPCALGSVNLEVTARAFGTNWLVEPSVGQFMLGRAPDTPPRCDWLWEPVNDAQWSEYAQAQLHPGTRK